MTASSIEEPQQLDLTSLQCAAGTDVGMRREENQDAFGIIKGENFHAYFVADGMGGVHGGAVASRTAISALEEILKDQNGVPSVDVIHEILQEINRRIFRKGSEASSLAGMGTTLVGLIVSPNFSCCVNVGDSRAYRIRGGTVAQLSEDHTLVQELVKTGAISPEQAEHHPVAHMLTRSLGPLEEIEGQVFALEAPQVGDIYVLCSDGLYNFVEGDEIASVVKQNPLDDASQILINLANQRGGADNITVVILAIGDNLTKRRSASYRHARDSAAQSLNDSSKLEDSVYSDGVDPHVDDEDTPQQIETKRRSTGVGKTQGKGGVLAPPAVQEPVETDRVEDRRRRARGQYHKPSRTLPVPVLVCAALLFGMVVGSLARRMIATNSNDDLALLGESSSATDGSARDSSGVGLKAPGRGDSKLPDIDSLDLVLGPDSENADGSGERSPLVEETFERSIRKLEEQIAALDNPSGQSGEEALAVARKRSEELQANLVAVNDRFRAATVKLHQWANRRKRLESGPAYNLADEVGSSSENVRRKREAYVSVSYAWQSLRDELELNGFEDKKKIRELDRLKNERVRLFREIEVDVRATVDTVLAETLRSADDLKTQRDMLQLQLESVKHDLDYAKVLADPDPARRQSMKRQLERRLQSLRSSANYLEHVVSGAPLEERPPSNQ